MLNETHDPDNVRLVCSYPTTPEAGGVVIYGNLVGIAEGDEDATTGETVVKLGPWIGDQSVTDSVGGGIAKGDSLFASKATPVVLSNLSTGVFFGWANAAVGAGLTATIEVIKDAFAGGVLGASSIGTTQLAAGAVTLVKVSPNTMDGTIAKNVAESDVIGGMDLVYMVPVTAGANADIDITVTHKIRVLDATVLLRGAGVTSAVFTVKNTANAITDGMAASGSDKAIVRAATIDDAYYEIAAGGKLRVTGSGGASMPNALVTVYCVRVA